MPIFEFKCENCSKTHETLVFKDEIYPCPYCGSTKLTRLISKPSKPQFKGSGFYETDYKKKK